MRAQLAAPTPAAAPPIEWVVADGGLPPRLDLADREALADWMLRERGRG